MKRLTLLLKRVAQLVPILLIVTMLAFWLSNVSAGDVATITLQNKGVVPTEESLAAIREELGLNDPLPVQYLNWFKKACRFDFGISFQSNRPVAEEIFSRFPATLALAVTASLLSIFIAVPVALLAARYRNGAVDHIIRVGSSVGATLPDFWIGLMLLYLFGVKLKIAPVVAGNKLENILLPAVTLSIQYASSYTRVLRENLVEIRHLDYMKAARARGLSEIMTLVRHGLKNAMLPVVTLVGVDFGKLVAGAVAIETIFSWNGIGQYAISSMKVKDLPVVQGYIMIVLLAYVSVNLILDILYMYIDPRIEVS